MRTSDYTRLELPFSEFNPAQAAVAPFFEQDVNLVVCFGTAVGKTAIAECILAYHLEADPHCGVVYSAPYRSLAREKFDSWRQRQKMGGRLTVLSTSDSPATVDELLGARTVVATAESLDSKSRSTAHRTWLRSVACFCFDEAHLLGSDTRGASMEAAMMRLAKLNPCARLILLSATLSNGLEVARWVKSLNGKPTKLVESDWRPVEVTTRCHAYDDSKDAEANKLAKVVEVVQGVLIGEKTLVFVHSKRFGAELVKRLREEGVRSAFHHASVSKRKRRKIEQAFDDPYSGLDVLVSTSTLSAGVNIGG